jgi:hypothetical protein
VAKTEELELTAESSRSPLQMEVQYEYGTKGTGCEASNSKQ